MSPDAWAVTGVGVALAGLILRMSQRIDALSTRVDTLSERVAALGERVAAIEGFLRGRSRQPWHGGQEIPDAES